MKVTEIFANFCDMCWFAFTLMAVALAVFVTLAITIAVLGNFGPMFWGLCLLIVVYAVMLFIVSYWEAYTHWKRNNV